MSFDADAFLQQTTSEAMAEERVPVPEGDHDTQIMELTFRDGRTQENKPWVQMTVKAKVLDPNIAEEMGLDDAFLYKRMFLDLTEDGALAFGTNKNVELGQLRAACGQNVEGEEWNLGMLQGASVGMVCGHRMNDKQEPVAEVTGFYNSDV